MGLDAMWQECVIGIYQVWVWLRYEVSLRPFLFLGIVIVIVSAWLMYKAEVRSK